MWSPQRYISVGKSRGISNDILKSSLEQIENTAYNGFEIPGILSLNHLAVRTKVPYLDIRKMVERRDFHSYRKFSIKKRSGGRRFIHVPSVHLMTIQKWISSYILKKIPVHSSSHAFSPGSSILKCASRHTGARWLIKMDITGFFESISEIQVYRVFNSLGYQPLVSFELARLSTVPIRERSPRKFLASWLVRKSNDEIPAYSSNILGYLPQGAPTSPMLSNLVMKSLDKLIQNKARKYGLTYTRYSDDLTFSTREIEFNRNKAKKFISEISKLLSSFGFRPQQKKTSIIPPGHRKIVLGLQVDGEIAALRKEFKNILRQHLYYLEKFGPIKHAQVRGFDSIGGMKSHIRGLIDFANMIESDYSKDMLEKFKKIDWPI